MISTNVASVCIFVNLNKGSRIGSRSEPRATYCESFSKSIKPGQFKLVEMSKYKRGISNDVLSIRLHQKYTVKHRLPMFA